MSDIYDGDISSNIKSDSSYSSDSSDSDIETYTDSDASSHMIGSIRKKIKRQIYDELNNYGDDEMDVDDTQDTVVSEIEGEIESEELFIDNLECVESCDCPDIDFVEDESDYEIINESKCVPIKNRYRKQTWYEYFRKVYMVTVILIISIVVYFYYSYSRRKENIVSKL
jgi:hypothetical protein